MWLDVTGSGKNIVLEKSLEFAVRIVKFYKIGLKKERTFEPIYKQLLKSATSIGANINEAQSAFTKKDFINKLGISLKESRETEYWLKLFFASDLINEKEFKSLYNYCIEITKLLTTIIKKSKENNKL